MCVISSLVILTHNFIFFILYTVVGDELPSIMPQKEFIKRSRKKKNPQPSLTKTTVKISSPTRRNCVCEKIGVGDENGGSPNYQSPKKKKKGVFCL